MLPAQHRLRRSADFAATVRRGRRAGRPRLVGHLLDSASPGVARVGFVVSKAVGGSVVRNRVERRLRHLVRDRLGALAPGAQLVVRAAPAAAAATWDELGADLDAVLARLTRDPRPADQGRGRAPRGGGGGS